MQLRPNSQISIKKKTDKSTVLQYKVKLKKKITTTCDMLSKLKSGRVAEKKRGRQTIQIVDHTQLKTTTEQK